jgi:clan AA aspartic protease
VSNIKGKINDLFESQIFIKIVTEKGIKEIEVVIDTGFNGDLVLPKSTISDLSFEYLYCLKVGLVGETIKEVDFFSGQIKWLNNDIIPVEIIQDESFLIGTNLLKHGKLWIDYQSNEVLIKE